MEPPKLFLEWWLTDISADIWLFYFCLPDISENFYFDGTRDIYSDSAENVST